MREIKKETEIDPRLRLSLALLHDACRYAPCYTWDGCALFDGVSCYDCPIKDAINFIAEGVKS